MNNYQIDHSAQSITAFNGHRDYPWVIAGSPVQGSLMDALDQAGLSNWNVRSETLTTKSGIQVPKRYATVRDSDAGPALLGIVGGRYSIVQNEEAFLPVQDILDSSDLDFETAGMLDNGRQVFLSLHLPEGILIGGQDLHEARLLATTSHDGSLAVKFSVVIGRFACFNALRPMLRDAKSSWSIRHTAQANYKIDQARDSLDLTFAYVDEFSKQMEKFLDESFSDTKFERVLDKMIPVNDGQSEGRVAAAMQRQATAFNLFDIAETNEFGRGTKYAAYNALTEYADWHLTLRGADPTGMKRAERGLNDDSVVAKFKDKAFQLVGAL